MKLLDFENMFNMRDCGGYATSEGKELKYDVLIRSDAPKEMNEKEINYLRDHHINSEIDMRTEEVIGRHPSTLKDVFKENYHNFPMHFGSQASLKEMPVTELYRCQCESFDIMASIFRTFLNAPGGCIVNCTAGKDRTGVVCAILFELCGVSQEDIIHDYEISAPFIDSKILDYCKTHPGFPTTLGVSRREDMMSFLDYLHKEYGNAHDYLIKIGLSEEEIAGIKHKLVD